jgi:pimeloyl-ACP methyl ester carboxylesterase
MSRSFAVGLIFACLSLPGVCHAAKVLPAEAGRLFQVGSIKLYVEISGNGPPLLFLHGGLNYFDGTFSKQKAFFSSFRTVIGVDQRGHGHSPDNGHAFSYREMADDTALLIRELHLGPADVVGLSDGGNVGLLLARHYPDTVRRLVISGANIRGDYDGVLAYLRFRLMSTEQFTDSLPSTLQRDYARVSPDSAAHWRTVVAKSKELWSTWVVIEPADLRAIHIPVLVMAGDRDVIPLDHTIEIYRALPLGQLGILPGTGHETPSDRSDEFNRLTKEFLERPVHP